MRITPRSICPQSTPFAVSVTSPLTERSSKTPSPGAVRAAIAAVGTTATAASRISASRRIRREKSFLPNYAANERNVRTVLSACAAPDTRRRRGPGGGPHLLQSRLVACLARARHHPFRPDRAGDGVRLRRRAARGEGQRADADPGRGDLPRRGGRPLGRVSGARPLDRDGGA